MTSIETAWLAGLLEGEGSFYWLNGRPAMRVAMCDQDVVERAGEVLGANVRRWHPPSHRDRGYKPQWVAYSTGWKLKPVMEAIRAHMGMRRGAKIDELLAWYDGRENPHFKPEGT